MSGEELLVVLGSMSEDYTSKTQLARNVRMNIDAILADLLDGGYVEGISMSGVEVDHFRLTEKGRLFFEDGAAGKKRPPLTRGSRRSQNDSGRMGLRDEDR